ncbi:MAG: hypothetical protein LBC18_00360 [Opitutaceae bacterium]|jgi:hypothetical protein|nr:hypothetical protein [Opitutaceae bacterium]
MTHAHTHPFRREELLSAFDRLSVLRDVIEHYPLSNVDIATAAVDVVLKDLSERAGFRAIFDGLKIRENITDKATPFDALREYLITAVARVIVYSAPPVTPPAARVPVAPVPAVAAATTIEPAELEFA